MRNIEYLNDLERRVTRERLYPLILGMTECELRIALFYIIHGIEIEEAIRSAIIAPRKE